MSEHTKGIWKLDQYGDVVHSCNGQVFVTGFALSCGPRNKEAEANARHIVHCVNNHERLVEAVKELIESSCFMRDEYSDMDDAVDSARTLLAQLEAGEGGE